VLFCKVLRVLHELLPVLEVLFCQVAPERVPWFGFVDEGDQRLDDLVGFGRRLPVLSGDNRQADLALFVNIRVVNPGFERDLRGFEGILGRKLNVNFKCPFAEGWGVGDEEALPLENVLLVDNDFTKRFEACFADVLELLLKTSRCSHGDSARRLQITVEPILRTNGIV